MIKRFGFIFYLAVLSLPAVAQERTAGGTLDTQASWTALQGSIGAVGGRVTILETDVEAMKTCAASGKIWQPGKGCVLPLTDTTDISRIIACGKQGKVYGPGSSGADTNGCKMPASTPPASTTPALTWTGYATEVSCPSGYKVINCQASYKTYGGTIDQTKMMEPIYTGNGCNGRTDSAEFGRDNPQRRTFTAEVRALCMK